jgi:hypothetical protein
MKKSTILFTAVLFLTFTMSMAQQTVAEKLGYPANTRLLIVHADDIGLAQSVNDATLTAFKQGGITSGSIMVPCPWFADFAEHYKDHPESGCGNTSHPDCGMGCIQMGRSAASH